MACYVASSNHRILLRFSSSPVCAAWSRLCVATLVPPLCLCVISSLHPAFAEQISNPKTIKKMSKKQLSRLRRE